MKTILFYISGHGYGHVVRMSAVMRAIRQARPDVRILARTKAPRHMLPAEAECTSVEIDSGVLESEAGIVMDEGATVERLKLLLGKWDSLVAEETAVVRQNRVDVIVADIPPMAGDIARCAGVPCIGISNFTWDWIYEPYAQEHLQRLEQGYSQMDVLLRLPFAQPERLHSFRRIVDAPLIARKSEAPIRRNAPLTRPRVLLGSRARASDAALARAEKEAPEFEFVLPPVGDGFPEALASCDLVIAKLGFSMVAEAIAARKPMLYPPRLNFREEAILQEQAPRQLAILPIPLEDFYGGAWAPYLRRLVALPPVVPDMRTDGARFCAEFLEQYL